MQLQLLLPAPWQVSGARVVPVPGTAIEARSGEGDGLLGIDTDERIPAAKAVVKEIDGGLGITQLQPERGPRTVHGEGVHVDAVHEPLGGGGTGLAQEPQGLDQEGTTAAGGVADPWLSHAAGIEGAAHRGARELCARVVAPATFARRSVPPQLLEAGPELDGIDERLFHRQQPRSLQEKALLRARIVEDPGSTGIPARGAARGVPGEGAHTSHHLVGARGEPPGGELRPRCPQGQQPPQGELAGARAPREYPERGAASASFAPGSGPAQATITPLACFRAGARPSARAPG